MDEANVAEPLTQRKQQENTSVLDAYVYILYMRAIQGRSAGNKECGKFVHFEKELPMIVILLLNQV